MMSLGRKLDQHRSPPVMDCYVPSRCAAHASSNMRLTLGRHNRLPIQFYENHEGLALRPSLKSVLQRLPVQTTPGAARNCGRQETPSLALAGRSFPTMARGKPSRSSSVVVCNRGSACCEYRVTALMRREIPIPQAEAINPSLPHRIVKATTGSEGWHGPCSERNPALPCTTSLATISRSAHARNTSPRLRHRAVSRRGISFARFSAPIMASRSFSHSCPIAKPRGGSTTNVTGAWAKPQTRQNENREALTAE